MENKEGLTGPYDPVEVGEDARQYFPVPDVETEEDGDWDDDPDSALATRPGIGR